MQEKTLDAILAMLTGLGTPTNTDADVLMRTYAIAVHGIREDCVVEVCGKYIRGEISNHKKGRAPATDIFTAECRAVANTKTAIERRGAPRIEYQPVSRPWKDWGEVQRERTRELERQGYRLIAKNCSIEQAVSAARSRKHPPGTKWFWALQEAWGPST